MALPSNIDFLHDCLLIDAGLSYNSTTSQWHFSILCPDDLGVEKWNGRVLRISCNNVKTFRFNGVPVAGQESINFCTDRMSDHMKNISRDFRNDNTISLAIIFHSGSSFECICSDVSINVVDPKAFLSSGV